MKAKKVLAMLMASAMIMGSTITAFAADPGTDMVYGTGDDKGTITVSGITPEAGITVTAYPIIKADYDENNNTFDGYSSLYPEIITEDVMEDPENEINQTVLNQIISSLVTSESYKMSIPVDGDGTSYTAEVPVGSYLVMIEDAETRVYNPVVLSVSYEVVNNENELDEGTVIVTDDNAWVKVSEVPTIDKVITEGEEESQGNSVNVGDTVDYEITIDPIPNYGGDHPVLNVVDTLSAGLTYNNDLTVKVVDAEGEETGLTRNTDYTLTPGTNDDGLTTLTVDFVVNNSYTLNGYVGEEVVISYSVTVNDDALVNEDGNNNNAVLNYTTDSKTTGNDGSDEDKTYTYTFDIDGSATGTTDIITKVGEDEDIDALAGAVFEIYQKNASGGIIPYTNGSGTLSDLDGDNVQDDVESDEAGQLYISGLAAGTYYLKEVSAPDEYSVNTHEYQIVIATDYNDDGTLKQWTVTIDGEVTSTFDVTHDSNETTMVPDINGTEIKNTKLSSLPSTGGIGTTIFTIGGCVIMVTAAGLYFATRKKEHNA